MSPLLCYVLFFQGCAKSTFNVSQSRIVGGNVAKRHSIPYQVLILIAGQSMCGGTILNRKFVLTARHCVDSIDEFNTPPTDVSVFAGLHDVCGQTSNDSNVQKRRVKRVVVILSGEFSFVKTSFENDIALVELSEPLKFDQTVQPACLPNSDVVSGQLTWVSGWGRLKAGKSFH
jgi:secreted trypsin-like serine protease